MNDLFVQKVLVNWELISSDSYLRKKRIKLPEIQIELQSMEETYEA